MLRENACKEIEKILKCSDGRRHICVITGEGGSGKSELAREYSRYAKNNSDVTYTDIYWLTCPEGADAAVDELMETVGIGKEDAVSLTVSKLLIFDNCNFNKFSFNRDLYEKTGAAHVIVTSRVQSLNGVSGDTLYLEKYQTEEFAMRVFRKNCESSLIGNSVQIPEEYQEMIKKLIRQISCNTLLAAMLGIALRDYLHLGETEFCEHLQMISNSIHKCLEDEPEIHLNRKLYGDEVVQDIADGEENIGGILQIIFSDELLGRYSETEYKILTLLKVCPNRFINKELILKLAVDTDQTLVKKNRIINRLVNDNWIKYGEINGEKEITMHPIIALAIKDRAFIDQKIEEFYNELLTKIVSLKINEPEYAEENRTYVSILLRNFENKMEDKLALSLTAYEYGDFSLADCIIKSRYKNNLQKPIAFMKGFGTKKKNYLYLIVYDGEKVIDFSTIKISNNLKIKGKIVWCWDNYRCNKFVDFQFKATVKCQCEYVEDIIEITEIAPRCFLGNRNIVMYSFDQSFNSLTGKIVEIEKIGEEAFANSEVVIFFCKSEAVHEIPVGAFYECMSLVSVWFDRLRRFEIECFYGCTHLKQILFRGHSIYIEDYAFSLCFKLERITYDTLQISKIGKMSFYGCQNLRSHIEISADEIEMYAFAGCKCIEIIQIRNVEYIGRCAFKECNKIDHIKFPDSIKKIDKWAFAECALKYIELSGKGNIEIAKTAFATGNVPMENFSINAENGQIEFINDEEEKTAVIEVNHILNLKNVDLCENLFLINKDTEINTDKNIKICGETIDESDIKKMEKVFSIKNGEKSPCLKYVYNMEDNMRHYNVITMEKKELPKIEKNPFPAILKGKNKLKGLFEHIRKKTKTITVSENSVGEKKYSCSDIEEINGEQVLRVEKKGLESCYKIKNINFPELRYIEDNGLFGCTDLKEIELPKVIEIGNWGLGYCTSLEKIEIPNVEKIGNNAFEKCRALKEIEIKKLKKIRSSTFENCVALEKVIVGEQLEEIGERAFMGCIKLAHFIFPDNLKKLAAAAFEDTALENIELPQSISVLEPYVFANTPVIRIKLNSHVHIKEFSFWDCEKLTNINWDCVDNLSRGAFGGCKFSYICFNDKISNIPSNAFQENHYLKSVEFRNREICVEDYAFYNCFLLEKIWTYGIKKLGKCALTFNELKDISFNNINYIGEKCFKKCMQLEKVFIRCQEEKLVIRNEIFKGCISLKEIWIDHDGEDEIEENAFPHEISIYVRQGSSIERRLSNQGHALCVISADEMEKKRKEVEFKEHGLDILHEAIAIALGKQTGTSGDQDNYD